MNKQRCERESVTPDDARGVLIVDCSVHGELRGTVCTGKNEGRDLLALWVSHITPLCRHTLSGGCDSMMCAAMSPEMMAMTRVDPAYIQDPEPCGRCCACTQRCGWDPPKLSPSNE